MSLPSKNLLLTILNGLFVFLFYGVATLTLYVLLSFPIDDGKLIQRGFMLLGFSLLTILSVVFSVSYIWKPKKVSFYLLVLISLPVYLFLGIDLVITQREKLNAISAVKTVISLEDRQSFEKVLLLSEYGKKKAIQFIIQELPNVQDPAKKLKITLVLERVAEKLQVADKKLADAIDTVFKDSRKVTLQELYNGYVVLDNNTNALNLSGSKLISAEEFPTLEFSPPSGHVFLQDNFKVRLNLEKWHSNFTTPVGVNECEKKGWDKFKKLTALSINDMGISSFEGLSIAQENKKIFIANDIKLAGDRLLSVWVLRFAVGLSNGWCYYGMNEY